MEQLLIRGLPAGTKARLDVLARRNGRSREAEVRVILDQALRLEPVSLADLLAMPESGGIEFEPGRLGALGRTSSCEIHSGHQRGLGFEAAALRP